MIPGSHACRAAMLMLGHKQAPYRRHDVLTLMHPIVVRMLGFDAGGEKRVAAGERPYALRAGDRYGTVPALAANGTRISTNRQIARFLDDHHPEPALFPADPEKRRAVEDAERWANEKLQMEARRITLAWARRDSAAMSRATADGRMGYLLYRRELTRRLVIPQIGRVAFAVEGAGADPLDELPSLLDRIDAWIEDGVLNGEQPSAADFMIAPSLALILYRPDTQPLFEGRAALELVDRLLPEPS